MLSRSSTRPRPGPPGRRRRPPPPRCGWRSWTRLESTAAKGANAEQLIAQLEGELLTERSRISELEQAAEVAVHEAALERRSAEDLRARLGSMEERVRCRVSAGDAGVGARGARDPWATRLPGVEELDAELESARALRNVQQTLAETERARSEADQAKIRAEAAVAEVSIRAEASLAEAVAHAVASARAEEAVSADDMARAVREEAAAELRAIRRRRPRPPTGRNDCAWSSRPSRLSTS